MKRWAHVPLSTLFVRLSVLFYHERWLYFATLRRHAQNDNGLSIAHERWLRAAGKWP